MWKYIRMKTTLDIPDSLMRAALKASAARTKRAAVVKALEDMVRRSKMAALAEELGNSTTFMTPEELESLREQEKASFR